MGQQCLPMRLNLSSAWIFQKKPCNGHGRSITNERLRFERRDDLGHGLPADSFDLVTCFEMIEHVDQKTQALAIESIHRLLAPAGKLVISTPNPKVTENYGENPFHLHEMNEDEFVGLLSEHFKYVQILRQWIRPSVLIAQQACPPAKRWLQFQLGGC